MNTLLSEARQFVHDKDRSNLARVVEYISKEEGTEAAHRWLRVKVLADLPREKALWFWLDGMGDRYRATAATAVRKCATRLKKGFLPESHWSTGVDDDGFPVIRVSPEARRYLLEEVPVDRHGFLSSVLICTEPST